MKITKLLICSIITLMPMYAQGELCFITGTPSNNTSITANNCQNKQKEYFRAEGSGRTYIITKCTSCKSGYILTTPKSIPGCSCENNKGDLYYQTCECNCNNCSNMDWHSISTGYEARITKQCNCEIGSPICSTISTQYRCAKGYYGTTTDGETGCKECPYKDSQQATSDAGNNENVTDCYIPSNKTVKDDTGEFRIIGGKCNFVPAK